MLSTNKTMAIADFKEHQYKRRLAQLEAMIQEMEASHSTEIELIKDEFMVDRGLLNSQITKLEVNNAWLWTWAFITGLIALVEALALLLIKGSLNP